ncbi:hypothetical protein GGX14DRAFT_608238 [Mycena pura]|uniref:Uncharacterized protein n=1 Tax=Mycena pura TaxID=153505 RepID=A0AAD6VK51_9AGAR|nr:hypothetical protein GGX14DRAFT_608238 [Mycena pura]
MHQSVHPSNLLKLSGPLRVSFELTLTLRSSATSPSPLQKLAEAAADGSFEDLNRILSGWKNWHERSLCLLLPVFYSVIDTTDTVTLSHQLESPEAENDPLAVDLQLRVSQILLSFQALTCLFSDGFIHKAARADLWSRIWGWTEFLDASCEQLPISEQKRTDIYAAATVLLHAMLGDRDAGVLRLFVAATGVRGVIGRAWLRLLGAKHKRGLDAISKLIQVLADPGRDGQHVENLHEFSASVGGSWAHLAVAVVSHLKQAFPNADTPITPAALHRLDVVKSMIHYVFNDQGLRFTFLEQGLAKVMATILLALSKADNLTLDLAGAYMAPRVFIATLITSFMTFGSERWIVQALRAGFLRAMFSYAPSLDAITIDLLFKFLSKRLPASTVYYSIVVQLHASLVDMQDLDPSSYLITPQLLAAWHRLIDLVHKRMKVVDEFKTGSLTALRACDNLAVGIAPYSPPVVKKQTGKTAIDQPAVHLDNFISVRFRRRVALSESPNIMFSGYTKWFSLRNRTFLRALVHHDYMRQQEDIALSALRSMHTNRSTLPYVEFNYTKGGQCEVSIVADSDVRRRFENWYGDDIRRAGLSGGRMQMHVMVVDEGYKTSMRSIPLRLGSEPVYQMLMELADTIPPPTDENPTDYEAYRGLVQEALRSAVQTH